MFILRTVEDVQMLKPVGYVGDGSPLPMSTNVKNFIIGVDYEVITHSNSKYSKHLHKHGLDEGNLLAEVMFLESSALRNELVLWKDEKVSHYIMTESGKTFEKL